MSCLGTLDFATTLSPSENRNSLFLFILTRSPKFAPYRIAVLSQEPTFKFHTITEILDLPDPEFLIDGLLVRGSFAVVYGPPGVGKSFLALSLAGALATENSWHGRSV